MRDATTRSKIDQFLDALGKRMRHRIRIYLVGGTVVVDFGLRKATVDIDYAVRADDAEAIAEFERLVPELKNSLDVNVEPASPEDFMPVRRGAIEKSRYVRTCGTVDVYYYDAVSTVLAKVARGSQRDLADVETFVESGLVNWDEVEEAWREVRERPTGWLRYTPDEIDQRLDVVRRRLGL